MMRAGNVSAYTLVARVPARSCHDIRAFDRPFRAWLAAGLVIVVVYDVASRLLTAH